MSVEDLSAAWEVNAEEWLAWARTPGHDAAFWDMNAPAFCELLPAPGLRTVDVGCGEGRVGRMLADLGHRVRGLDSSPTLVDAAQGARAGDGEHHHARRLRLAGQVVDRELEGVPQDDLLEADTGVLRRLLYRARIR